MARLLALAAYVGVFPACSARTAALDASIPTDADVGDDRATIDAPMEDAGSLLDAGGPDASPGHVLHCPTRDIDCASCGAACSWACVRDDCGEGVTQLTVGFQHACALRANGTVACWGANDYGQLGDGTLTPRSTPVVVSALADATQVSAGAEHTCAVRSTGAVVCWGDNEYDQLGDGTSRTSPEPVAVSAIFDAVQISAGYHHTCALRNNGTIACWGDNWVGQLGDGTTTSRPAPVTVVGVGGAAEVAAGAAHTCARLGGTVTCWGNNGYGAHGDGTESDIPVGPDDVLDLLDAAQIGAGGDDGCALSGSRVTCWGYNINGELGDGTTTNALVPVMTSGIFDAVAVAVGDQHTCALRRSGAVACWGFDSSGELGDGTSVVRRLTPVDVVGLGDAVLVAAGSYSTCALRRTGSVVCWGDDSAGELGDGDAIHGPLCDGPEGRASCARAPVAVVPP